MNRKQRLQMIFKDLINRCFDRNENIFCRTYIKQDECSHIRQNYNIEIKVLLEYEGGEYYIQVVGEKVTESGCSIVGTMTVRQFSIIVDDYKDMDNFLKHMAECVGDDDIYGVEWNIE